MMKDEFSSHKTLRQYHQYRHLFSESCGDSLEPISIITHQDTHMISHSQILRSRVNRVFAKKMKKDNLSLFLNLRENPIFGIYDRKRFPFYLFHPLSHYPHELFHFSWPKLSRSRPLFATDVMHAIFPNFTILMPKRNTLAQDFSLLSLLFFILIPIFLFFSIFPG